MITDFLEGDNPHQDKETLKAVGVASGCGGTGENLAQSKGDGRWDSWDISQGWMDSPGHRENVSKHLKNCME